MCLPSIRVRGTDHKDVSPTDLSLGLQTGTTGPSGEQWLVRGGGEPGKRQGFIRPRRKRLVCAQNNELLLPFVSRSWEFVFVYFKRVWLHT